MIILGTSVSGTIGGAVDREWKNHKYTSRHRNKDGKWVYDTEPMEEGSSSVEGSNRVSGTIRGNGSNRVSGTISKNDSSEEMSEPVKLNLSDPRVARILEEGRAKLNEIRRRANIKISMIK